jgi:hypothetical protein
MNLGLRMFLLGSEYAGRVYCLDSVCCLAEKKETRKEYLNEKKEIDLREN